MNFKKLLPLAIAASLALPLSANAQTSSNSKGEKEIWPPKGSALATQDSEGYLILANKHVCDATGHRIPISHVNTTTSKTSNRSVIFFKNTDTAQVTGTNGKPVILYSCKPTTGSNGFPLDRAVIRLDSKSTKTEKTSHPACLPTDHGCQHL